MLGDVHGKRGFAHGRAGGDDEHFPRVQAAGHVVEHMKPGGQSSDATLVGDELLDAGDRVVHHFLHRRNARADPLLADL